jgi:hypothetical protein
LSQNKDILIAKAAAAYNDHIKGETFIVIINQAIYFDNALPQILLKPN